MENSCASLLKNKTPIHKPIDMLRFFVPEKMLSELLCLEDALAHKICRMREEIDFEIIKKNDQYRLEYFLRLFDLGGSLDIGIPDSIIYSWGSDVHFGGIPVPELLENLDWSAVRRKRDIKTTAQIITVSNRSSLGTISTNMILLKKRIKCVVAIDMNFCWKILIIMNS